LATISSSLAVDSVVIDEEAVRAFMIAFDVSGTLATMRRASAQMESGLSGRANYAAKSPGTVDLINGSIRSTPSN